MKYRTGKECTMMNCKNHEAYSNWCSNLGHRALTECMWCKYSHVSQYQNKRLAVLGESQRPMAFGP